MKSDDFCGSLASACMVFGFAFGVAAGALLGSSWGGTDVRNEAVRNGVGRYTATERGQPAFEWITPEKQK